MTAVKTTRQWLVAVSIITIVVIVWYFQTIVAYVFIAGILAIIGRPVVEFLQRIRIRKHHLTVGACAFITLMCYYAVITLFICTLLPLISNQADIIASINLNSISASIQEPLNNLNERLHSYHIFKTPDQNVISYLYEGIYKIVNVANLSEIFNSFIGFTGNIFVALFSISFISFFFLKDPDLFGSLFRLITPDSYEAQGNRILANTKRLLRRYFVGLLLEIIIVSILISIGLEIIGIENSFLIGFLGGILIIVPYIGSIAGSIFGILLGISTHLGADFHTVIMPLLFKMSFVFLFVHTIDPIIFQPIIYAKSVKAHPLEIFLVILIAGKLAGVPGMIVAIPAYTLIRIVAKEFLQGFKIVEYLTRNI
ncbi:MAG: AI-2E family transporter [Bacteroidota bacterium]